MQIRIGHLYGQIMNTYGDWGNIAALLYRCRQRGIAVEVTKIGLGDDIKPKQYDLLFFGGGQDSGQAAVAPDLQRLTQVLRDEVEDGIALMSVCGGYQLLGQSYVTAGDESVPGIGVLPVDTKATGRRMMNNIVVAVNPKLDIDRSESTTLVGFENHSGQTVLEEGATALGRVVKGNGNNGSDGTEGVIYKSAIGTYLHGSCLPKNPHLTDWLIKKSLKRRYGEVELIALDDTIEWRAHRIAVGLKV